MIFPKIAQGAQFTSKMNGRKQTSVEFDAANVS